MLKANTKKKVKPIPYGYRPIISKNLNVSEGYISEVWNGVKNNEALLVLIRLEIKNIKRQKLSELCI